MQVRLPAQAPTQVSNATQSEFVAQALSCEQQFCWTHVLHAATVYVICIVQLAAQALDWEQTLTVWLPNVAGAQHPVLQSELALQPQPQTSWGPLNV